MKGSQYRLTLKHFLLIFERIRRGRSEVFQSDVVGGDCREVANPVANGAQTRVDWRVSTSRREFHVKQTKRADGVRIAAGALGFKLVRHLQKKTSHA